MDKEAFEKIIAEFPKKFDNLEILAKELRDILFLYRERLFTGTYRDPDKLYKLIIDAFNRAIARCTESELDERE
jgi:hypothetical protein